MQILISACAAMESLVTFPASLTSLLQSDENSRENSLNKTIVLIITQKIKICIEFFSYYYSLWKLNHDSRRWVIPLRIKKIIIIINRSGSISSKKKKKLHLQLFFFFPIKKASG